MIKLDILWLCVAQAQTTFWLSIFSGCKPHFCHLSWLPGLHIACLLSSLLSEHSSSSVLVIWCHPPSSIMATTESDLTPSHCLLPLPLIPPSENSCFSFSLSLDPSSYLLWQWPGSPQCYYRWAFAQMPLGLWGYFSPSAASFCLCLHLCCTANLLSSNSVHFYFFAPPSCHPISPYSQLLFQT